MDKYEFVRDIGSGSFGLTKLMRNKETKELVAVKFIERGPQINEKVAKEIINHRSVRHPNIIRFKEVVLTPTHLMIVMEYASGGELLERIISAGRLSEDEKRIWYSNGDECDNLEEDLVLEVEEESKYDKQVKEVHEDKQVEKTEI